MPQPRWGDIRDFCRIDEWEHVTPAGRRRQEDHFRYCKELPDGTILRTRASHGNDQIGDPGLWSKIWRHQMQLEAEDEFWEALRTGDPVDRGPDDPDGDAPPTGPTKPGWLVAALLGSVGLAEAEVREMSEDEASKRWEEFCTTGR